jgi:hypothetical protein
MQDGEKDGCWFMTMIWYGRESFLIPHGWESREEKERDTIVFSGKRGRERELYIYTE